MPDSGAATAGSAATNRQWRMLSYPQGNDFAAALALEEARSRSRMRARWWCATAGFRWMPAPACG